MKFEAFSKVIELLKTFQEKEGAIFKHGIDLFNFNDDIQKVVTILIGSIYGKDGLDTFEWWCYDNEWGTKGLTMTGDDGKLLCQTIEELHQYLEENKSDDYEIQKPLSEEEYKQKLEGLKGIF